MNLCQGITVIVFLRKAFSEQKQFKIPFENGPCVKLESVFKTFFDVMLMACRVFYEVFTNVINISLMNFWSLNLFLTCWVKKNKTKKKHSLKNNLSYSWHFSYMLRASLRQKSNLYWVWFLKKGWLGKEGGQRGRGWRLELRLILPSRYPYRDYDFL